MKGHIKCRVWDQFNGHHWIEEGWQGISSFWIIMNDLQDGGNRLTVEYFTTIKDHNGIELYDGDLICNYSRNGGKPHPIIWDQSKGAWVGDYGTRYLIAEEVNEITKVGDIHDVDKEEAIKLTEG